MLRKLSRKTIISISAVLFVLLACVATIALLKGLQSDKDDPYRQPDVSQSGENSTSDTNKQDDTDNNQAGQNDADKAPPTDAEIDPSTVATIDVEPMSLTVSYVKGVGGFEYEVLRTPRGTKYVEFRNSELVGTKCTNDQGTFASILAEPLEDEGATISKKVVVDGTTYGLSLATEACTSNPEKLRLYQASFSDAFALLEKLN